MSSDHNNEPAQQRLDQMAPPPGPPKIVTFDLVHADRERDRVITDVIGWSNSDGCYFLTTKDRTGYAFAIGAYEMVGIVPQKE